MNRKLYPRKSASVPYVAPCPSGRRGTVLTVFQMPTFIVFKDGNKVNELVGANPQGLQVCTSIMQGVSACYSRDMKALVTGASTLV